MVHPEDEVYAITSAGGVIRTAAAEVKLSGRQTMGVRLVNLASGQSLVAIARNAEAIEAGIEIDADDDIEADGIASVTDTESNDGTGADAAGSEINPAGETEN